MNKPIRRWMVFLVCIAFAGQLLVGCSAKSQGVKTDRSDKKQLKIGFTIDTLVLERWTRDRDVIYRSSTGTGSAGRCAECE